MKDIQNIFKMIIIKGIVWHKVCKMVHNGGLEKEIRYKWQ